MLLIYSNIVNPNDNVMDKTIDNLRDYKKLYLYFHVVNNMINENISILLSFIFFLKHQKKF